jgi:hypothetical protein
MEEVRLRQATNIDEVTEFLEQGESYDRICWDLETDRLEAGPENITALPSTARKGSTFRSVTNKTKIKTSTPNKSGTSSPKPSSPPNVSSSTTGNSKVPSSLGVAFTAPHSGTYSKT